MDLESRGIVVAKTKALISFVVTAKLICVFVFAYAKCWFSHDTAHMIDVHVYCAKLSNTSVYVAKNKTDLKCVKA